MNIADDCSDQEYDESTARMLSLDAKDLYIQAKETGNKKLLGYMNSLRFLCIDLRAMDKPLPNPESHPELFS